MQFPYTNGIKLGLALDTRKVVKFREDPSPKVSLCEICRNTIGWNNGYLEKNTYFQALVTHRVYHSYRMYILSLRAT